jgi:hypothetical protein
MTRFTHTLPGRVPHPRRVRVLLVGLGPIGIAVGRALAARPDRTVVGAVDPAPELVGRPLRDLLGEGVPARLRVVPSLDHAPDSAEVAVHAAGSVLEHAVPAIEALLSLGLHVVSTCEPLFHPLPETRREFERLDAWARKCGKVVVGGGVNPGFTLDVLPLTLASAMARVDRVEAMRVLDARTRRRPLQRKVCVGEDPVLVRDLIKNRVAGHVGLLNSGSFLAESLGWPVNRAVREISPVVAERALRGPIPVRAGMTAGIEESLRLYEGRVLRVSLKLVMAAGAAPAEDRVRLHGEPPLELVVPGGIPGDQGTVGQVVNLAGRVADEEPGLRSVADLALPRFPHIV